MGLQLAAELKRHVSQQGDGHRVVRMPHPTNVVHMIRATARDNWIGQSGIDPSERQRRLESDFLDAVDTDGQMFDFHSLRHTCGAWLVMSGVHPKVVQTVMQHSTMTLTMDTYGQLFPGQEVDAIQQMQMLFRGPQAGSHQQAGAPSGGFSAAYA